MPEAEHQQRLREFVKQLEHYPQVGKRPYGYPKAAWWMSGAMAMGGLLLQLPLYLADVAEPKAILAAIFGGVLFGCGFTLRVVAFTSAVAGAMDRWLYQRIEAVEKGRTGSPGG